mmetsp:Transcript_26737/g.62079  ORF Transcript_26737/g.62079 Transcript_26737/m.62079 type:complete len:85 (-) Transcript_26737:316-570(-)
MIPGSEVMEELPLGLLAQRNGVSVASAIDRKNAKNSNPHRFTTSSKGLCLPNALSTPQLRNNKPHPAGHAISWLENLRTGLSAP